MTGCRSGRQARLRVSGVPRMLQKTVALPLRRHYHPRPHAFYCLKLAGSHGLNTQVLGEVPTSPFSFSSQGLSCLAWPWGEAVFKEVLGQTKEGQGPCAPCANTAPPGLSSKSLT